MPPRAQKAPPKPALSCDIAALQAQVPPNPPDITLGPGNSSGRVIGGTVTLPASTVITLTGDLTLVAKTLLDIQGRIEFGARAAGRASPNLTLVCVGGPVKIHHVRGGSAAPGVSSTFTVLPATASGGAGANGGYVKVWGVSIEIDLEVAGDGGGDGGTASADNSAGGGRLQRFLAFLFGLPATAVGGQGGAGGDVLLCAVETIRLWDVFGGSAGDGGWAEATADAGALAWAEGGPGNDGGDVTITGVGAVPVRVRIDDVLKSGRGGLGDHGKAIGGDGLILGGGRGKAIGGDGGKGAKITFVNATVTLNGSVVMGDGGPGGSGTSGGGDGANGRFGGHRGGDATAQGGTGGPASPPVTVPLAPPAQPAPAAPGTDGYGGDADATPGDGGNRVGWIGGGAPSGSATAAGGPNGAGTLAAGGTPGPTPATPPAGAIGGAGAPAAASQTGAP